MYFKIETCHYAEVSCQIYTVFVVVFVLLGYVLQYMSCFRRDRGLGFKQIPSYPDLDSCDESLVFGYILPYLLHFCGYLCAIFTFRSSDDEQLQSLMERVNETCIIIIKHVPEYATNSFILCLYVMLFENFDLISIRIEVRN